MLVLDLHLMYTQTCKIMQDKVLTIQTDTAKMDRTKSREAQDQKREIWEKVTRNLVPWDRSTVPVLPTELIVSL